MALRRWLRDRTAEIVVVHQKHELPSVRGFLTNSGPDGVLLSAPVVLLPEVESNLEGELWIPRENVAFIQLNVREK